MERKREELIDLIPAYRRGELTPAKAHEVARAFESDPDFAREAEREEVVIRSLVEISEVPLPKKIVARAVLRAVGDEAPGRWFSLDTLLIAIGVGVACAAVAQLLASRLTFPLMEEWLIDIANLAAGNAVVLFFGVILAAFAMVGVGAWLAVRVIRS